MSETMDSQQPDARAYEAPGNFWVDATTIDDGLCDIAEDARETFVTVVAELEGRRLDVESAMRVVDLYMLGNGIPFPPQLGSVRTTVLAAFLTNPGKLLSSGLDVPRLVIPSQTTISADSKNMIDRINASVAHNARGVEVLRINSNERATQSRLYFLGGLAVQDPVRLNETRYMDTVFSKAQRARPTIDSSLHEDAAGMVQNGKFEENYPIISAGVAVTIVENAAREYGFQIEELHPDERHLLASLWLYSGGPISKDDIIALGFSTHVANLSTARTKVGDTFETLVSKTTKAGLELERITGNPKHRIQDRYRINGLETDTIVA